MPAAALAPPGGRDGRGPPRWRGAALLLFLALLLGAGAALLLSQRSASGRSPLLREAATPVALQRAKRALIAHAVTYYERKPGRFGVLPCPDLRVSAILPEGSAHGSCGGRHVNSLGRLPWRTLGIAPPKDAAGECLWYAVAGEFKANPAAQLLNHDTGGNFRVRLLDSAAHLTGAAAPQWAAAVIVAPGAALPGQDRRLESGAEICGGNYRAREYLEAAPPGSLHDGLANHTLLPGPDAIDDWLSAGSARHLLNDRILHIGAEELFRAVRRRGDYRTRLAGAAAAAGPAAAAPSLLRKAAECLAGYGRGHANPRNLSLPWPAPLALARHRDRRNYDDLPAGNLFGRLPDIADDSAATLGAGAARGKLLSGCADFASSSSELRRLWENWKDHLFYAVADAYQPRPLAQATPSCGGGRRCIAINRAWPDNAGRSYAAVLWFAGARLHGQRRDRPADRAAAVSYLEGVAGPYQATPGDDAVAYRNRAAAADFNDILYCLLPAETGAPLRVVPCPRD
ncbi:MAG: hypothetical protein OXU54_04855 [Gammaproteobacteria bacterium]|nr:hypothetical protein [Gammaproteobacteria bacterium]